MQMIINLLDCICFFVFEKFTGKNALANNNILAILTKALEQKNPRNIAVQHINAKRLLYFINLSVKNNQSVNLTSKLTTKRIFNCISY